MVVPVPIPDVKWSEPTTCASAMMLGLVGTTPLNFIAITLVLNAAEGSMDLETVGGDAVSRRLSGFDSMLDRVSSVPISITAGGSSLGLD